MNELISTFLLIWDTSMPEIHLRQPGFTYNACGPFTRKTNNTNIFKIHLWKKLDKALFQHDMTYQDFEDLKSRDKPLKCDRYQRGPTSLVYEFFDKKSSGHALQIGITWNQQLTEELHIPIIRKFEKRKSILIFWQKIFRFVVLKYAINR